MRGTVRTMRIAALMLVAGSSGACRDVGLPGNIPRAEAENRQYRYILYQAVEGSAPIADPVTWDGRNWLGSSDSIEVPERLMQSVATVGGIELFAPVWSSAPHDRLYVRAQDGGWHPLMPVI